MGEMKPLPAEAYGGKPGSFRGNSEHIPVRPGRVVSPNRAAGEIGYPSRPAVRSPHLAEARSVAREGGSGDNTVVYESSRVARVGSGEQLGCLRPVDPGETVRDGVWEWLNDYRPITYGELEALKKQGLPRPKYGSK